APAHPPGVGLRGRGRFQVRHPHPPGLPGRALLVGLPRLPRPGGQPQGGRPPGRRPHRRGRERGLPVRARADHLRPHLPPPQGQVLRRPLTGRPPGRPYHPVVDPDDREMITAFFRNVILDPIDPDDQRYVELYEDPRLLRDDPVTALADTIEL